MIRDQLSSLWLVACAWAWLRQFRMILKCVAGASALAFN